MEVHHHNHPSHGKKNWKTYFWEFLMLFLAVFCGFLAEYQLEHKIEKDRERQLLKALVVDLETDLAKLDSLMKIKKFRLNLGDSLRRDLINGNYKANGARVYLWARNFSRRVFFLSSDGTLQQLKNSGGLRLITNQPIKNSINDYDLSYRNLQSFQSIEEQLVMDYRKLAAMMFDAGVFLHISNNYDTLSLDLPLGNPQILGSDSQINELSNRITYWVTIAVLQLRLLEEQKNKGESLIQLIKKEYKFK